MTPRALGLPAVALALVAGVLGVQVAHGGGTFEPLRPPDPCVERPVTSRATGIDGLTERLVLLGIAGAACRVHESRESFVLRLAGPGTPSDQDVDALRAGLLDAVRRTKADGTLPPASALLDEVLPTLDLNRFVRAAIGALPDAVVNGALKTDDVLSRTIEDLDLRQLLANLDDQGDLERQVEAAVVPAVKDALVARVKGLL